VGLAPAGEWEWLRGAAEGGEVGRGLDPSVIPWSSNADMQILAAIIRQYVSPSELRGAHHDFALVNLGESPGR